MDPSWDHWHPTVDIPVSTKTGSKKITRFLFKKKTSKFDLKSGKKWNYFGVIGELLLMLYLIISLFFLFREVCNVLIDTDRFWRLNATPSSCHLAEICTFELFWRREYTFGFGPFTNQRVTNKIVKKRTRIVLFLILTLTVIWFISHNLHSTIVITDNQCRSISINVAIVTIIPLEINDFRWGISARQTLNI